MNVSRCFILYVANEKTRTLLFSSQSKVDVPWKQAFVLKSFECGIGHKMSWIKQMLSTASVSALAGFHLRGYIRNVATSHTIDKRREEKSEVKSPVVSWIVSSE